MNNRKPRGRAKVWLVQAWDDDDGWATMETTDCQCFQKLKTGPCYPGCAVKKAKYLEELEGKGNVRVVGAVLSGVMWPLGQVIQTDVVHPRHYRRNSWWDYGGHMVHEEIIL